VDRQVVEGPRHRAAYTLEQGVWLATCRICGFTAKDVSRSSAATWFLTHIREVRRQHRADEEELKTAPAWEAEDIDVREPAVPGTYDEGRPGGGDRPPPKGERLYR
jgi:hypothetical protein